MFTKMQKYQFLFEELVKRDFKQKYKRTALGMVWSVLSPLLNLFVLKLVFTEFFGKTTPHFTTYLFCGLVCFNFFTESTTGGMRCLVENASIFTKVNVPKYLFLFSKNVSALINLGLTLVVFFAFCIIDHITFTPKMILLLYPIACELIFNLGIGMILSALYVFFKDIRYLYEIFITLLRYLSAIFYNIDRFDESAQKLFLFNPVYVYIKYFRIVVIDGAVPPTYLHALCALYACVALRVGCYMYKKYNHQFLYYV